MKKNRTAFLPVLSVAVIMLLNPAFEENLVYAGGPATKESGISPELPEGAELIFADDFNRAETGDNWLTQSGRWEIIAGADLQGHLAGAGEPGELILKNISLPENFRIEYTAWSGHPGDRSVFVDYPGIAGGQYSSKNRYLFQFGGSYSTENKLMSFLPGVSAKISAGPEKNTLPEPDKKYRVIIRKEKDMLELFINVKLILSGKDPDYYSRKTEADINRGRMMFYTWSEEMCFDDLKVFRLATEKEETGEKEEERRGWQGFEEEVEGNVPEKGVARQDKGGIVAITNEPTVIYHPRPKGQELARDLCVSLENKSEEGIENASYAFMLRPMNTGAAEVEILVDYGGGTRYGTIALVDTNGSELASLVMDNKGYFFHKTGEGLKKLNDEIHFPNRSSPGKVYLQQRQWMIIRFNFNSNTSRYNAEVIELYHHTKSGEPSSCILLGENLSFLRNGKVSGIKVSAGGKTKILADNFMLASPANPGMRSAPLRTVLGLDYPKRKDPISLVVYSLRNETTRQSAGYMRGATDAFINAGFRYHPLLIREGMLDEKAQMLMRWFFYLENSGSVKDDVKGVPALVARINESRNGLDNIYRIYGNMFRDGLNEEGLEEDFYPAADTYEKELAELEEEAEKAAIPLVRAAGNNLAEAPLGPGPEDGKLEFMNGRYERKGKPVFVFLPYSDVNIKEHFKDGYVYKLLGMDNIQYLWKEVDPQSEEGKISFDKSYDRSCRVIQDNPDADIWIFDSDDGTHECWGISPKWWLEKNKDNKDIFFQDRDGNISNFKGSSTPWPEKLKFGGYRASYNFWNPDVQQMYKDMCSSWSRYMSEKFPGRVKYLGLANEQRNRSASGETGFNESAVAAFRERLKGKYKKTIEKLNRAWGTEYKSFDEIDPRHYTAKTPNGLMYEFQMFRQDGYWEWMKLIRDSLKKNLPDLVIMNDAHHVLGGTAYGASFDMPAMFGSGAYDVVGHHWYRPVRPDVIAMYRMQDDLRKVYGTAMGDGEWAAGLRNPQMFDEEGYKSQALIDTFLMMAWGHSVLRVWYGIYPGFSEGAQWFVPNLAHSLLRYHMTYLPVARQRTRRFIEIALTNPTVTPKLVIIEPTASHFNGLRARHYMLKLAMSFEDDRWNYGYRYEDLLLSGQQSLKGVQTAVIPMGLCLKPGMAKLLLDWMEEGGELIALFPPGVYNQYGLPDGEFINKALGNPEYTFSGAWLERMAIKSPGRKGQALKMDDGTQVIRANYGKGRLHLITTVEPYPENAIRSMVRETTARDFESKEGVFSVTCRNSDKYLYFFIINTDHYEIKEDVISVLGQYGQAHDIGGDYAFPVKTEFSGGRTAFHLRLHPAEGTVIRVEKIKKAT